MRAIQAADRRSPAIAGKQSQRTFDHPEIDRVVNLDEKASPRPGGSAEKAKNHKLSG
jgi:hypothetical protein